MNPPAGVRYHAKSGCAREDWDEWAEPPEPRSTQPWERAALAALRAWMRVHDRVAGGVWRAFVVARTAYRASSGPDEQPLAQRVLELQLDQLLRRVGSVELTTAVISSGRVFVVRWTTPRKLAAGFWADEPHTAIEPTPSQAVWAALQKT